MGTGRRVVTLSALDNSAKSDFLAEVRRRHGVVPSGTQWYCVPDGHFFDDRDLLVTEEGQPGCPQCQLRGGSVNGWNDVRPERWASA